MVQMTTYNVPAANMAWLQDKLAKLNRRFKRIGKVGQHITLETIREYVVEKSVRNDFGKLVKVAYPFVEVAVHGEAPKAAGWHLVAQIEHTEAGNLIRALPGKEVAESWRTAKPSCEHCNASRWRTDTFLLQHENGRLAQIGRSCIKDFLGHVDPQDYAAWAKYSKEIEDVIGEASESWGRVKPEYTLDHYLAWVAAVVRLNGGYVSTAQAREAESGDSTGGYAGRYMTGDSWLQERYPLDVTPEDEAAAAVVLAWLDEQEARSDYMHNLKTIRQLSTIVSKHFNLAASIYGAWKKATEERVQREVEERTGKKPSEYFGTVGKRETFTLTYMGYVSYDTMFGMKFIEKFTDEAGNAAVWNTGTGLSGVKEGETIKVKATVKGHSEFRSVKQTELQRLQVID